MFGENIYHIDTIKVGETKSYPCGTSKECAKIRKAAHNYNARERGYYSTRCKDGHIHVTRIR